MIYQQQKADYKNWLFSIEKENRIRPGHKIKEYIVGSV